jgi:hypothetical protein
MSLHPDGWETADPEPSRAATAATSTSPLATPWGFASVSAAAEAEF